METASMGPIRHEAGRRRFVAELAGESATLSYRLLRDGVDFVHTWVPPARRCAGVGRTLVRYGLAWADENGLAVTASCGFVRRVMVDEGEVDRSAAEPSDGPKP